MSVVGPRRVSAPIRVCVIGNSQVGAVLKAYQDIARTPDFLLYFFASPGKEYDAIGFDAGQIRDARFDTGGGRSLADYDVFVIYGRAPRPLAMVRRAEELDNGRYSRRVRFAALQDWLASFPAPRHVTELQELTDAPVYMLPVNPRMDAGGEGPWEVMSRGADLFQDLLAPARYISFPRDLFDENLHPRTEFYRGSLTMNGVVANPAIVPDFHLNHFNFDGGVLILQAILARLRADLLGA